jgi:hypothetical protein
MYAYMEHKMMYGNVLCMKGMICCLRGLDEYFQQIEGG